MESKTKINHITTTADITVATMELLVARLKEASIEDDQLIYNGTPLTSEQLQTEAIAFLANHNHSVPVDPAIIIGNGIGTADPHFAGTGVIMAHTPIVIDIYPQSNETKYFADMTRTFVKGDPSDRLVKMYQAVEQATNKSLAEVRAGAAARSVYECAATSLLADGFDVGEVGFVHSLGHGVSTEIHDDPKLSATSEDILKAYDVITIEPGLYYPDIGGVRLEDTIVVTKSGYEILTNFTADWVLN